MQRNEVKVKSGRKPMRDLSNNNGGKYSKSNLKKMMSQKKHKEETLNVEDDDALDRLLLVQSDLSSLVQQIDELVAQAFRVKAISKSERKDIESFSHLLSDMLSSLKPWVPRFQKAFSMPSLESESNPQETSLSKPVYYEDRDESNACDSPEETKLDSLISPSPLVSWRANCTIERGRQMFMLTPLPISKALSSKRQETLKSEFNRLSSSTAAIGRSTFFSLSRDMTDDLVDGVVVKPTPMKPSASVRNEGVNTQEHEIVSSPSLFKRENTMLVMTPCLKMSPPKSCVLLEPIYEFPHLCNDKVRKSTPFPVGIKYSGSESSESGGDVSQDLGFKYPELLGINQISKSGIGKKLVEASPDWFMSPPKTCVLLEPPDGKSVEKVDNNFCIQKTGAALNQEISKLKDDVFEDHNQTKKSCNEEHFGGNLSLIESTPMWNEPESSFRTGKCPGENTLKKELWTKFEAATTHGLLVDIPTVCNTTRKGFLDLLEEASCDK